MAIIPAEEKVFMVSNSTNTTYSGSAALKAMQQWYTMQDVIDSVPVTAPTLQQVTETGNTTDVPIIISMGGGDTAIYGSSEAGHGGVFSSGETYSLVASQSAAKPGGGSWDSLSDSRVKENIKPYSKGLAEILLVSPVNYEYNGLANTIKGIEYTGIIAQEIKEIFPETVVVYKARLNEADEEKTELYSFNSTALTFALINAIKELNEKIKILEAK